MRIAEVMALVVPPVTEQLRRSRARQGERAAAPMYPTIVAVRGGRVVSAVSSPRLQATLGCALGMAVGLDPAALVVATEVTVDGEHLALAYTVMTRDRRAKWALQEVHEATERQVSPGGAGRQVRFTAPVDAGEPQDRTVLDTLAEAMAQRPLDPVTVNRKDHAGTFGNAPFLPPEQGRVVLDAGTVRTLHEQLQGSAGQALYLPRSPEAGRLALDAGLPRRCLVVGEPTLGAQAEEPADATEDPPKGEDSPGVND